VIASRLAAREWRNEAIQTTALVNEAYMRLFVIFGGLTIEETGAGLGVSPATVKREWSFAKGL
jgi:ECF sigma factor